MEHTPEDPNLELQSRETHVSTRSTKVKLHRQSLYDEVWSTPMIRLAPKYGLSDVGLRKICRKLNVPTPRAGYWAKLAHGKKVRRTPLSPLTAGTPDVYTIQKITPSAPPFADDVMIPGQIAISFELDREIRVSDSLRSPHPLIKTTRAAFEKSNVSPHGKVAPGSPGVLDISVHRPSIRRALRIMNAVVKEADRLGMEIRTGGEKRGESYFIVNDEEVPFRLEEKTRREKRKNSKYSWDEWDYLGTGELALKIKNEFVSMPRKTWSDTKAKKLEDRLGEFLRGVLEGSLYIKADRLRREAWHRKFEEEQERRRRIEQERQEEERRRRKLEEQTELWNRSQNIRSFIAEVERMAREGSLTSEGRFHLETWLLWAGTHADRIDPLKGTPPYEIPSNDIATHDSRLQQVYP